MASATHENFVLLFRRHPELAFELARRAGVPLLDRYERLEEAATEFENPLTGTSVRTDFAMVGYMGKDPRHGLAVEVQLGVDLDKAWSVVLCPAWTLWFNPNSAASRPARYAGALRAVRI